MNEITITIPCDSVDLLLPMEVAERLMACEALTLDASERIGEMRVECGVDLEIDIHVSDQSDPRIDGHLDHTETYTLDDLRTHIGDMADYMIWVRDEDGCDYLACFKKEH